MATSVTASYTAGDMSQQRLGRPVHHHQSILPLRRERTMMDGEFHRSRESKPVYSHELPVRSTAFSGGINNCSSFFLFDEDETYFDIEKQYDRRHLSSQVRSAKSEDVIRYFS
jgi:hypothetical protein